MHGLRTPTIRESPVDLIKELEERAVSYDQSVPSAEHTAKLLRKAANALTNCHKEIFRLREQLLSYSQST